jgi:uncharacterized lipoprotein YbaY/heat shock protein HslJ
MASAFRAACLLLGMMAAATATPAAGGQVTGTATYRERIALPPQAVFEAILEDVSRADAPAPEIGRTTIEGPGQPPITFAIAYDRSAIDERLTYAVRARVLVDGRLLFTTDTVHTVLTRGAPDDVTITMKRVSGRPAMSEDATAVMGAHGLRLPATFTGDLPCADCEGVRHRLNLWPDQVFMLGRSWLGTDRRHDAMGRWSVDPERRALVLWGVGEQPLEFEILDDQRLLLLTRPGKAIASDLVYELTSRGTLEPLDGHLFMGGMFVYLADAARFTECLTDRSFPVAMEGDYLRLEKAYLAARKEPGQPLMVSFEGGIEERSRMEGGGTEATAVARRFVNVWPGETCERNHAEASLTNTYWRIVRLGETEIRPAQGRREPHLLLRSGEPRFAATVGCNRLIGGYELSGETLRFTPAASTMMACPPPLDADERRLGEVLAASASWNIHGQVLELFDKDGKPVALFHSVYLR